MLKGGQECLLSLESKAEEIELNRVAIQNGDFDKN